MEKLDTQILENLKGMLEEVRGVCELSIEDRMESIDEAKINKMLSQGEQVIANNEMRKKDRERRRTERERFIKIQKELKEEVGK